MLSPRQETISVTEARQIVRTRRHNVDMKVVGTAGLAMPAPIASTARPRPLDPAGHRYGTAGEAFVLASRSRRRG